LLALGRLAEFAPKQNGGLGVKREGKKKTTMVYSWNCTWKEGKDCKPFERDGGMGVVS